MARSSSIVLLAAALAAVAVSGCRKEEQNRPMSFTPGVYQGEPMPTLTKDQVMQLQKRGQLLK